ncbi:MAG: hypothetical protein Q8K34_19805, partial [Hydrogenophaga sp.]|nr:hypothetical protein [Hydrogenophaga sp.]
QGGHEENIRGIRKTDFIGKNETVTQVPSQMSSMVDVVTAAAKESGMTPEDFSELIIGGLEGWCAALQACNSKAKPVGVTAAPDQGPRVIRNSADSRMCQNRDC